MVGRPDGPLPATLGRARIRHIRSDYGSRHSGRVHRPAGTVARANLSGYLEAHRSEYYDRLQAVRERGNIQEWLQFFLTAVRRSAEDAVERAERLVGLRERYLGEAATTRSNLSALVGLMFTNPFLTTARVQQHAHVTNQGARNLIKEAERKGWVDEVGSFGRGGRIYWLARDLYTIIDAPPAWR